MSSERKILRRDFMLGAGCLGLLSFAGSARAATYPDRPVSLTVPFAAGGPTDATARLVATGLSGRLPKQVIVENRSGAGGTIGAGAIARAKPDGYSLLWAGTSTMVIAPYLLSNVSYDPRKSFAPISRAATGPLALVVHPSVNARNISEFVALCKSKPNDLNFGSAGVGSIIHLAGELFKSQADIQFVHVPFGGNAVAMQNVIGGEIQFTFAAIGHVAELVHAGQVRALGVTSAKSSDLLPGVPSFTESSFPNFEVMEWFGLAAPAGTPPDIIRLLHDTYLEVAADRTLKDRFAALGYSTIVETPAEFAQAIDTQGAKWASVIKSAGITL